MDGEFDREIKQFGVSGQADLKTQWGAMVNQVMSGTEKKKRQNLKKTSEEIYVTLKCEHGWADDSKIQLAKVMRSKESESHKQMKEHRETKPKGLAGERKWKKTDDRLTSSFVMWHNLALAATALEKLTEREKGSEQNDSQNITECKGEVSTERVGGIYPVLEKELKPTAPPAYQAMMYGISGTVDVQRIGKETEYPEQSEQGQLYERTREGKMIRTDKRKEEVSQKEKMRIKKSSDIECKRKATQAGRDLILSGSNTHLLTVEEDAELRERRESGINHEGECEGCSADAEQARWMDQELGAATKSIKNVRRELKHNEEVIAHRTRQQTKKVNVTDHER